MTKPTKPQVRFYTAEVLPYERRKEDNADILINLPLEDVPDLIARLGSQLQGAVHSVDRKGPAVIRFRSVKLTRHP